MPQLNTGIDSKEFEFFLKALNFASVKHKQQKRKLNGLPYIIHPVRVAEIVRAAGGSSKQITAALLHDTVEDTETKPEEILNLFGKEICDLVLALTNDDAEKDRLGKKEYLARKFETMDMETLLIKLADRLDNVNDLSEEYLEWSRTYADQTDYILKRLDADKLPEEHQRLYEKIKKQINHFIV